MFWVWRMLPKSPPGLKKLQICGFQIFFGLFQTTYKPLLKRKPFQWYVLNLKNPKAHMTSKGFRFVAFRPFSVFFRPPKKELPVYAFWKRKPFQWYVWNLKNATQKPTRPQKAADLWFSDHLKSSYLFKPLPHMSKLLKRKPFQWYVLNLKNVT